MLRPSYKTESFRLCSFLLVGVGLLFVRLVRDGSMVLAYNPIMKPKIYTYSPSFKRTYLLHSKPEYGTCCM